MVSPLPIHAIRQRFPRWRLTCVIVLSVYLIYLAKFFFFPIRFDAAMFPQGGLGLELRPILPLAEQLRTMGTGAFLYQAAGNLLSFLPITFLCAAAYPNCRTWRASLCLALSGSLLIELAQLLINLVTQVTNRAVDINDVLLNVLGGLLGFAGYRLVHRMVTPAQRH